jgi:hypothetical protein
MANWWDKNLTDKQKFRLQEPKDPSLLDVVSAVPTPVGDVASGLLAAQDVSKGNYGSAALNSLGLLPFVPAMGGVLKNSDTFEQLAKTGKMRQAKNKEQEINDLISGKSKFAEVRLNWDDPKTYDLADKLKAQGFDSTVTQQGKDMVTLFHKSAEDVTPVLNAKTPYDFGKAYGYSDNDIAAFYNNRYGKDAEKYWKQDSQFLPAKTEFEAKQLTAQKNAALPVAEGGLGLPANNTAMDRAKAMGNDTLAYTGSNIEGEIESMLPKSWFSKEPGYSSTYSTVIPSDGISKNPRVYPVLLRTGKTEVNPMFGLYEDMEKALSKKKTDTFKVEGVGGGTNDFYVTKNPNQVRSIYAAFDPFRRNEADILAGIAPVAAGSLLGLNTYNNMQDKPKKEKKKTK